MNIEITMREKTAVLVLDGRMDADQASLFEKECERLVAQGTARIIVDLEKLKYVSSMGLRSFLHAAKICQAAQGRFALVHFTGFVKQVFDVTRLSPLFQAYETVDQALKSMQ